VSLQNGDLILIWIIQLFQSKYTQDLLDDYDEYHTEVIRSQLTRNIANTFKEVREELIMGMDDLIPVREDSAWQCLSRKGYISHSMQSGSRSPFQTPFNAWFAVPRIVFLWEFLYVRVSFSSSTFASATCADIFYQAGTMTTRL
jgi:hypothetical protein